MSIQKLRRQERLRYCYKSSGLVKGQVPAIRVGREVMGTQLGWFGEWAVSDFIFP